MDEQKRKFIRGVFRQTFLWLDNSDADTLYKRMEKYIIRDVTECADPEDWNDSDVRCAIRRVLFNELEIQD